MADSYVLAVFKASDFAPGNLVKYTGDSGVPLAAFEQFVHRVRANQPNLRGGFVVLDDSGTEPAGTITCLVATAALNDTVTLTFLGQAWVFTAGTDFPIGDTDDELAANLAAAINGSPSASSVVTATVAANVITVTGNFPGAVLEDLVLSTSNAVAFALVQIGTGVAGVNGAANRFWQGRGHRYAGG